MPIMTVLMTSSIRIPATTNFISTSKMEHFALPLLLLQVIIGETLFVDINGDGWNGYCGNWTGFANLFINNQNNTVTKN